MIVLLNYKCNLRYSLPGRIRRRKCKYGRGIWHAKMEFWDLNLYEERAFKTVNCKCRLRIKNGYIAYMKELEKWKHRRYIGRKNMAF